MNYTHCPGCKSAKGWLDGLCTACGYGFQKTLPETEIQRTPSRIATLLKKELRARGVPVSHGLTYELMAAAAGYDSYNLACRANADVSKPTPKNENRLKRRAEALGYLGPQVETILELLRPGKEITP